MGRRFESDYRLHFFTSVLFERGQRILAGEFGCLSLHRSGSSPCLEAQPRNLARGPGFPGLPVALLANPQGFIVSPFALASLA
jgi:hypothetical protein